MDVILHVGAHRTGTTTFQRAMTKHAPGLKAQGMEFWGPDRTRRGMFAGLIRRQEGLTDETRRLGDRSCGRIRIEVERLAHAGREALLVSDENMLGAMPHMLSRTALYPDAGARLARFAPGFAERCTTVLLSVRDYRSWWPSVLAFAMGQGQAMPDAGAIDRLVRQPRRWRHVVQEIAMAFPAARVSVAAFEGFAHRPGARLALAMDRPLPAGLVTSGGWHNRSPDMTALRHALAQRPGATTPGAQTETATQTRPAPWRPFTPAQLTEMGAQYQDDLHWLRHGADGLARFHEAPAPNRPTPAGWPPGPPIRMTGPEEGYRNDGQEDGVGYAGQG